MNDFVVFGIIIFIIGFLAGILATMWWNSRRKNEPEAEKESTLPSVDNTPIKPEIKEIPFQPVSTPAPISKTVVTPQVKPSKPGKPEKSSQPAPKQVDMVTAINDILQELIRKSDKPTQVVSLTPEPPVGVAVWVNGKRYDSLDAVDDNWTRELVRTAVAEWERKALEKG